MGETWQLTREPIDQAPNGSSSFDVIKKGNKVYICHAFNAVAMNEGALYIVSMLTEEGKLFGNFYDGQSWGKEAELISDNVTKVAGDDRRLSLEFDPIQKRAHLIYIDAENILRYRYLDVPYQPENRQPGLSESGLELARNIFTCALSMDKTRPPCGLVITYGKEKHAGKDKRERTGELYARRFDGLEWQGDEILMSQQGSIHNWYPNVNQDCSDGLCMMYSRSVDKSDLGKPLAVMVSSHPLNED